MSRLSPDRLDDRISNHTAHLIIIWPLILACAAMHWLAWQAGADSKADWVSAALTIFETFLVLALAGGFWMVRRDAVERAEEAARGVARELAEREVEKYVKGILAPKLLRALLDGESDLGQTENEDLDDDSARDMIAKLDQ